MKIDSFRPGDLIPGFDSDRMVRDGADEHLTMEGGGCSLWWNQVPSIVGERPGMIGHFEAGSVEVGRLVLGAAVDRLRQTGCSLAVGPMDGNTWRRYRVLTERGPEPTFLMEPDNPDCWKACFEEAGFAPLASYVSWLVDDLEVRDERAARARVRLGKNGIRIRTIDRDQYVAELRRIFEVSLVSFTRNFLYTPLAEEAFLGLYQSYREKVRPELVFLAEKDGQPVGYLFAIPDYAEAARGEVIRTVVGKTLAILPGRTFAGLGLVLVQMLHDRAAELGYSRVVHALQNESNSVGNLSEGFGKPMRRYTLYSRSLP